MPIYAYRCTACGHAQDVLQKISDPLLTVCPACGASAFEKQVTAAGFQLKGSGWYVTDFRGGNAGAKQDDKAADGAATKPAEGDGKPADKPADAPAEKAPAAAEAASPSPTPAAPTPAPATGS